MLSVLQPLCSVNVPLSASLALSVASYIWWYLPFGEVFSWKRVGMGEGSGHLACQAIAADLHRPFPEAQPSAEVVRLVQQQARTGSWCPAFALVQRDSCLACDTSSLLPSQMLPSPSCQRSTTKGLEPHFITAGLVEDMSIPWHHQLLV